MSRLRLVVKDDHRDAEMAAVLDAFTSVADALGLDTHECAALLRVHRSALPLRFNRPTLNRYQEQRMRHIVDIGTALALLLGDADQIVGWMWTPCRPLGNVTPLSFILRDRDGLSAIRSRLTEECLPRFGPVAWIGR